jgi:hypothetical protein
LQDEKQRKREGKQASSGKKDPGAGDGKRTIWRERDALFHGAQDSLPETP